MKTHPSTAPHPRRSLAMTMISTNPCRDHCPRRSRPRRKTSPRLSMRAPR
ncbi:hypothetical protein [Lysobacter gummosus]